jgi:Zn-dependent peptidase ImmA (M78 family)/transcriptional regulator with XRE-family HTH domain
MSQEITNSIAERVKYYRNYLRLPQSFVAEALKIDTSTYSRIEMGKSALSASNLKTLANLFSVSVEEFFEPLLLDHSGNQPIIDAALFRNDKDFRSPNPESINAVTQAINDLKTWALDKENGNELEARQKKSAETGKIYNSVNEAIEACTPLITKDYMIGDSFDIYRFIRWEIGPWISWNSFGTFSGIYLAQNYKSAQTPLPIIGIHTEHISERQRFSAAHELGHHLLKHTGKIGSPTKAISDPEEKDANQFAANLLMEKNKVLKIMSEIKDSSKDIDLLKIVLLTAGRLQVSFPAILNRLTSIGEISHETKERLAKERPTDTKKDPTKKLNEQEFQNEIISEAEKILLEKPKIYEKNNATGGPKTPNHLRFLQDYSYVGYIEKCKAKQPVDSNQVFQEVVKYVSERYPRYKIA